MSKIETTAERIALVLNSLPAYVEAELSFDIHRLPTRVMVRDLPTWNADGGRRCTNLTSGTEWFITTDTLTEWGVLWMEITKFDNRTNEPLWSIA